MSASAPMLKGRRVLVVEDRYLIANELAQEVQSLGGEVVGPSPSVAHATNLIARENIDIALLDVNLDGEFVYPLAQALDGKGVPIVFLTGYDDAVLPAEWGARPRLLKPILRTALREELAKCV